MENFEGKLEEFYRSALQPGDTCIDVGAHLGRHTIPMAKTVGRDGRIFAFEPLQAVRDKLNSLVEHQFNLAVPMGSIAIYPFALSDHDGIEDFVEVKEFPEYSGLRERTYDSHVTRDWIKIEVRRLDGMTLPLSGLRYIKVDVEGGDYLVLRGAERVIRRHRPLISFEFGDNGVIKYPHTSADMFDYLHTLDYTVVDILGNVHSRESFINSCAAQRVWDYIAYPAQDMQELL